MKNYTSLEQSKQLIAAGLDPKTADMHYKEYHIDDKREIDEFPHVNHYSTNVVNYVHPCWSVGALIAAINSDYTFGLAKDEKTYSCLIAGMWFRGESLVDMLVDKVLWLLEEGYIKKGE